MQFKGMQLLLLHNVVFTNAHPHRELAESVRLLVAAGADINAVFTDSGGDEHTALMCAVERQCCTAVLATLLQTSADPCVHSLPKSTTALHIAAQLGWAESCKMLLARADTLLEARDASGRTALRYAVANGHLHTVQVLLQCGADINAFDSVSRSALFSASSLRQVSVAACLLKAGADVNAVDSVGDGALVAAVHSGSVTLAQLLLDYGADITVANKASHSALFIAAHLGDVSMMKLLVQRGLRVTAVDATGATLLMQAASSGHTAALE
jgi:uncharacterized protein